MKWMKRKPTPEDKENGWNEVIDGRQKYYETMVREHPKNKAEFHKLFNLEFDGGNCWTCGLSWKRKEIDTRYMKGKYFVPVCDCFVTCPVCNSPLYDLQFKYNNLLQFCDNCKFQLHNTEKNERRYGKVYKSYYDNLDKKEQYRVFRERYEIKNK